MLVSSSNPNLTAKQKIEEIKKREKNWERKNAHILKRNCPDSFRVVQAALYLYGIHIMDSYKTVQKVSKLSRYFQIINIFQTVSKLSGYFQMTPKLFRQFPNCLDLSRWLLNLPHSFKTVRIFPEISKLSCRLHNCPVISTWPQTFQAGSKQRNRYAHFVRKVCVREKLPFFVFLCPWRHLIFVWLLKKKYKVEN